MFKKQYYVYILTNRTNSVLYCGVTENLIKRTAEHKRHINPTSFSAKYHVEKLVFYEVYSDPENAIKREKQIKGGSREKKNVLIEQMNPEWNDLFEHVLE